MQNQTSPLILSFGVADPVGATGIQADLATFAALGCHGLSVTTGVLIGDTARVEDIDEIDADWVSDQARVLLEDMPVAAFKVGALTTIEQVSAIAEIVSDYPGHTLILDPFLSQPARFRPARRRHAGRRCARSWCRRPRCCCCRRWSWRAWPKPGARAAGDMLDADVAELTGMGCAFVLVTGTAPAGKGDGANIANTLFGADGVVGTSAGRTCRAPSSAPAAPCRRRLRPCWRAALDAAGGGAGGAGITVGALAHAQRFGMGKLVPEQLFRAAPRPELQPDRPPHSFKMTIMTKHHLAKRHPV